MAAIFHFRILRSLNPSVQCPSISVYPRLSPLWEGRFVCVRARVCVVATDPLVPPHRLKPIPSQGPAWGSSSGAGWSASRREPGHRYPTVPSIDEAPGQKPLGKQMPTLVVVYGICILQPVQTLQISFSPVTTLRQQFSIFMVIVIFFGIFFFFNFGSILIFIRA